MTVPTIIFALLATGATALVIRRLVAPPPRLEVGDRGIRDRNLGRGWIRWSEIEGAYPPTPGDAESLLVKIRVNHRTERFLRRGQLLSDGGPAPSTVEVRLSLADNDLSPLELLEEILARDPSDSGLPMPEPRSEPAD